MALTIDIEGTGVIANADLLTNDTGGLGTGDWLELGGGTISSNPDVYLYGSASIGNQYASKSGFSYFDIVTPLDFDIGGAQEDEFIYMWINISSKGAFKTGHSFAIRLGVANNTNYRDYRIADKNDSNGWSGGWKLFVIDPTKPGSVADTGSYDYGNIRYIGLFIDTDVSVRADSIFFSQIAVGKGIRITGTSSTGWAEAVAYCTNYASRAWGMLQEREGIYYAYGKIFIGSDNVAPHQQNTVFAGLSKVIQFGTSEYYYNSAWVPTIPVDSMGIIIEDHASYTTSFTDGVIAGTDGGRSGCTYIGNENHNVIMSFYGGNNAASVTKLYGTSFVNITGPIAFGTDVDFQMFGVSFQGCSQVNPVGALQIRNCNFISTISTAGALLWNENMDIADCNFISNTVGAGIQMPGTAGSPYDYNALFFSDNTYDINSTAGAITINCNDLSDPTTHTPTYEVTFENPKTFKFTLNPSITGYEWRIYEVDALGSLVGAVELDGEETASADNQTYPYTYGGDIPIAVQILAIFQDYIESITYYTLKNGNQDITIYLSKDENN